MPHSLLTSLDHLDFWIEDRKGKRGYGGVTVDVAESEVSLSSAKRAIGAREVSKESLE